MAEVTKYDSSKLMEMVRDRIRATYVELIPEEQWTNLVKKEIENFFHETNPEYYDRNRKYSIFGEEVRKILAEKAKEKAVEVMAKYEGWGEVNAMMEELVVKNAPKILADMIGGAIQNSVNNSLQQLRMQC